MDALIYSQQQWKDDITPRMTIIPREDITPRGRNWEEGRSTGNSLVKSIMKSDSIKIYIQGFIYAQDLSILGFFWLNHFENWFLTKCV